MDSIFAKFILFFASTLTVFSGPNYIQLETNSLNFDFRTGENFPVYYFLNVQNTGPEKERFEISSDQPWVSARREGADFNFVELPSQANINFVLEIRPERLTDGVNEAKVNLRVLDIDSLASQELVLDEAEVLITLNKNIGPSLPILSPTPEAIPALREPSPGSEEQNRGSSISQPGPESPGEIGTTPAPDDLSPILKQLQSIIDSLRLLLLRFF